MKHKFLFFTLLILFSLRAYAVDTTCQDLAKAIAADIGDEPFVVRVAYGEMLLNRLHDEPLLNTNATPTDSDMRAAAAALANFNFSGGATHVTKLDKKSAPPENTSGVRLYDWYFYKPSA